MTIDVIILSYAKNDKFIQMNNNCINSLINSTSEHKFKIHLIETESTKTYEYEQENVTVIQPNEEFNYNRFLNIGLKHCTEEWILISNNDTLYSPLFLEHMLQAHEIDNELLSMSPIDFKWHRHAHMDLSKDMIYGYRTSYELTGWSILVNRKVFDIIGEFDEKFKFWYQDNDYSQTLFKHDIKHALIPKSHCYHLTNASLETIRLEDRYNMTDGLRTVFTEKWG